MDMVSNMSYLLAVPKLQKKIELLGLTTLSIIGIPTSLFI